MTVVSLIKLTEAPSRGFVLKATSRSLTGWLCLLGIANVCLLTSVLSSADDPQQAAHIRRLKALVDFLETEQKRAAAHLSREAGSEEEFDNARVDLAKARHDLAIAENDQRGLVEQCKMLLDIRIRQLRRQTKIASLGFKSDLQLSIAMRRLAGSRFHLSYVEGKLSNALRDLEKVVQLCKDELGYLTKLQADGASSLMEVNRARHRATIAAHHLAFLKRDSRSVLPELRQSIEVSRRDLDQIRRLRKSGYADIIDEYVAHSQLLNVKLLSANLEKDKDSVRRQFDDLIRLHLAILPRLGGDWDGRLARVSIERELARDQARLTQFLRDGSLSDDLSVAMIGL